MEILISATIGAIISWLITHTYFKLSKSESNALSKKLSDDLRKVILDSTSDNLTVLELNEILSSKTVERGKTTPHKYIACPRCGSKKLHKDEFNHIYTDYDESVKLLRVKCKECGWQEEEQPEGDPYAFLNQNQA